MSNVTELPNIETDKFRAGIEALRRNMPLLIEHHQILAQIRRKAYEAYTAQGFTPEQSIELCKTM